MKIASIITLIPLMALSFVPAESQNPAAGETMAIRARRVETAAGPPLMEAVIVIRDGKIVAVGTDARIPAGARVIVTDTVMPGIIGAFSRIGLSSAAAAAPVTPRPGFAFGGFGGGGAGRAAATPHYRVVDELYPFDEDYARLLRVGVTTLGLFPSGTGINGQGAAARLKGESGESMALNPNGALAINFSTDTQAQQLIRSTLEGARQSSGSRPPAALDSPPDDPEFEPDDDFQRGQRRGFQRPTGGIAPPSTAFLAERRIPVARAVNGEIPTFVSCIDASAALYASQLIAPFEKLKSVLIVPSESYRIAELLGEKKSSVIIPASLTFETATRNRVNPAAMLSNAGVKVACRPVSDNVEGYSDLRLNMAQLVRAGLARDTALKAITLHPAQMLGIAERVGSIETGRDANLILLDGDPFAATTRIRRVLLEGKEAFRDP